MSSVAFADVVHQTIYFRREVESEALALELVDTAWFQRLRDIAQTGSTSLVYMFSEHSRFGHCLGVAYLANHVMDRLAQDFSVDIEKYRCAVSAAALLHDIGHIAPGSHTAYKTWYPVGKDCHEEISVRVVREDPEINEILSRYDPELPELVCQILSESPDIPAWTWEIISGSGWNVDRGNWCIVDSVMAGVSYGRYNIPALVESIVITDDKHIAVKENRLDAVMHFTIARHSMYRQVYQHRVLMAADTLGTGVVKRLRDLESGPAFADDAVLQVLKSSSPLELDLPVISAMRESWWKYHLSHWASDSDVVLSDLANRVLNRRLFKTVRVTSADDLSELLEQAQAAVQSLGLNPDYYLHSISTTDVHAGDYKHSMMVQMDDGRLQPLAECEPVWNTLATDSKNRIRTWLVMPAEAKKLLKRER